MAGKLTHKGQEHLVNNGLGTNLYVGLYTNSTEPTRANLMANIEELSGGGYERKILLSSDWSNTGVVLNSTEFVNLLKSWLFSEAVDDITGYFISDQLTSGDLLAVEHFSGVLSIDQITTRIELTPKIHIE